MLKSDTHQVIFLKKGEEPKIKLVTGLRPYLGGLGVATKLYTDFGFPSLAVGPLSGSFPSSGVAVLYDGGSKYSQLGGDVAVLMALRGVDGVVAEGYESSELPGVITEFLLEIPEKSIQLSKSETYEVLYNQLYTRVKNVWFKDLGLKKACTTCPLGCGQFLKIFTDVNLCSLLGTCQAVASVYNEIPIAFAALRALGYDYSHEELENAVELTVGLVRERSK